MAQSSITIPSGEQMGSLIRIVQDFVQASDRVGRKMLCLTIVNLSLTIVVTVATIVNAVATIVIMNRH